MSKEQASHTGSQDSLETEDRGIVNPSGPQEPAIHREEDDVDMEKEDSFDDDDDNDEEFQTNEPSQETQEAAEATQDGSSGPNRSCCEKVMRGIRALWATRQTEDTKENRELHVKTTLREMCVFVVFLVILCIVAFGMTTTMTFYYTSAVTAIFIDEPYASSSTFKNIGNAEEWFEYALGPLMKGLYNEMWPEHHNMSDAKDRYVLFDSKVLGVPRLRLVRVRNDSCIIHEDFRTLIKSCYGGYSAENEDTQRFGLMNGTAWEYQNEEQLDGSAYWGQVSMYNGGGYVQDLSTDEQVSRSLIQTLSDNNWLERGTRAVFIDFSLYNANINLFCVVRLLCEFPATGGVLTSWTLRTVKLIRYITVFDYVILACECIFVLFIAYYIVEEALEIKRHKLHYFKSFWSILDLVIIATSICCISFNIYRTVVVDQDIDNKMHQNPNQFVDLNDASYWQLIFNYTLAVMVFLTWIKLFKFISFNKTMMQLSTTLGACAKDLIGFSIMFFIVFLAFAQLGYLLFGTQVEDYCKFESCIFSQFRILLGDFNFDDLERANRVLGPAYFVLFVFFMFFILMNMFVAIIIDTYSEVKAELSHRKNDFEMTDYFKRGYQKMLDKLNLRRKKAVKVQKSVSSDKRVDYHEWHKDLKRRGYAEAEIVAVCSKYDLDKGHVLTAAEVRKMQADLDRKKRACAYDNQDKDGLDSLDESDEDISTVKSSLQRMSGGGVSHEEFSVLQRRVDRMEHSIGSIVSKIDAVLVKLENMEHGRAKRRETMTRLLDSIAESEGITDESKQHYMERLVRDELERWDSESCISGGFDPSPASSSSGRGSGRGRLPPNPQDYPASSNA